ncbi:MAG: hypothetical protein M1830_008934 [Pleopsidium flavum]|nr:MAG: hypothetical protein M1830_008934 [Pleopsidium flavum]
MPLFTPVALIAVATLMAPALGASSSASSCSVTLTPTNSITPTVASGYRIALVATALTKPRSMKFDNKGNLLVVQQGAGIAHVAFKDDGGVCLSVSKMQAVVKNSALNHGLALSNDGKTLYASSAEAAYSWPYDPETVSVGPTNQTLVTGMNTNDHTTRTLLMSQKANGTLLISRGSTSNVDLEAETLSSGHSQIKAFDLNKIPRNGYDFNTEGLLLGWGLRNSVGVSEHPVTGGIYSVENSVDEIMRDGKDIHQNNPGEEMNFHGYLNGTEYAEQGGNYGYPYCFAAWSVGDMPNNSNLTVGSQFTMGTQNGSINDTFCAGLVPPRLTFQAHMAPLDIVFNNSGTEAWVTFHGSWDRTNPVGYKLSVINFDGVTGEPTAGSNSNTAATDVLTNEDSSRCPKNCFRPAGIAFDSQGRLFMSSDATGEIYVVLREKALNVTSPTTTGTAPAATSSKLSMAEKRHSHSLVAEPPRGYGSFILQLQLYDAGGVE